MVRKATIPVKAEIEVTGFDHTWCWLLRYPGHLYGDDARTKKQAWAAAEEYVKSLGGTMEDGS